MESSIELTDTLAPLTSPAAAMSEALEIAIRNRGELAATEKRREKAQWTDRAAELEKLPHFVIYIYGDYGALGSGRIKQT